MREVAPGIGLIDDFFLGQPEYIGTYTLDTGAGLVLVDPGPSSTLVHLEAGLAAGGASLGDVSAILLTHIHLDHAGATGTLARRNPGMQVYVHQRGAPHLADPTRLLASATRLYGDRMDELWGDFEAVPRACLHALEGGENLRLGSHRVQVEYTPGHAKHHVSFLDSDSGTAFIGDTVGIRIDNRPFVMPVTPPPDIDREAWTASIARIRDWAPSALAPTHFGLARPAAEHLDEHEARLDRWIADVGAYTLQHPEIDATADAAEAREFRQRVRGEMAETLSAHEAFLYATGGGLVDSWHGLARYHRKRKEGTHP